jgi:hypothetical protein
MKTFTVLNSKTTFNNPNTNKKAIVVKVIKEGTKRTFFSVQNEDNKFITRTMFAREYDANRLAKLYCNE